MKEVNVDTAPRPTGSSAARRLRREGQVPCVLYSRDTDPVHFQMPALQVKRLAFSREAYRAKIHLDGESWDCVLKDLDLDPITDEPIHADFQVLQEGENISLTVPVQFIGTPVGQTEGGDTQYILNEIDISCLPQHIPDHVEVNVSELDIGDAVHVSDLSMEGVQFESSPQQTVVTVVAPFIEPVEEEEPVLAEEELAEEGEMAETAEGEAPEGAEAAEEAEEVGEDEDFEEDL